MVPGDLTVVRASATAVINAAHRVITALERAAEDATTAPSTAA
jgi:hypothetical protein